MPQGTTDPQPPQEPQLHLFRLLPNLISILALCSGLTAIRFAIAGNISVAVFLIALAAALDGLDGRLARMLKSESAIGAELDSLCDFVNFGVVPGLVLYLWGLGSEIRIGWIAVLIYAVCCMLRLARFNVGSRKADPAEKTVFIGVPSPAGAMLALLPIYVGKVAAIQLPALAVAAWMVAVGAPASLRRFGMLQCFDSVRVSRLPVELQPDNPLGVERFVDGSWTTAPTGWG